MKTKSHNKKKQKDSLISPSPIDKIKLQGAVCVSRKSYYDKRIQRHRDAAEYHKDMADKGIHTEYHEDKAAHHDAQASKLIAKRDKKPTKKDIGPMGSVASATGAF